MAFCSAMVALFRRDGGLKTPCKWTFRNVIYDSCVTAGKNQCECCALLAFKYIAACEDVGEFAHPLRRFK